MIKQFALVLLAVGTVPTLLEANSPEPKRKKIEPAAAAARSGGRAFICSMCSTVPDEWQETPEERAADAAKKAAFDEPPVDEECPENGYENLKIAHYQAQQAEKQRRRDFFQAQVEAGLIKPTVLFPVKNNENK